MITGPTSAVVAVDCAGTEIQLDDPVAQAIVNLINAGVVIEIEEETLG